MRELTYDFPWQTLLVPIHIHTFSPPFLPSMQKATLPSFFAVTWSHVSHSVRRGDKVQRSMYETCVHVLSLPAAVTKKTRLQRVVPLSAWIPEWLWGAETPGQPTMSRQCKWEIKYCLWNHWGLGFNLRLRCSLHYPDRYKDFWKILL